MLSLTSGFIFSSMDGHCGDFDGNLVVPEPLVPLVVWASLCSILNAALELSELE